MIMQQWHASATTRHSYTLGIPEQSEIGVLSVFEHLDPVL